MWEAFGTAQTSIHEDDVLGCYTHWECYNAQYLLDVQALHSLGKTERTSCEGSQHYMASS